MLVGETSRQRLMLCGGGDAVHRFDYRGDTWTFDGSTWQQLLPDTGGPALAGARAAADGQGRLLLFGGLLDFQPTGDTWVQDSQGWTRLLPAHAPAARQDHSLAADPLTNRIYLFGGIQGDAELGDVWRFDGADWQPLPPGPPARSRAALAFDSERRRLLLYGGEVAGTSFSDTWEFDGQQWQQRAVGYPPNDGLTYLAYDQARRRSVLITYGLGALQTWEWDGTWWYATNPPERPRESPESTLVYEPLRQRVLLVQGYVPMPASGPRGETWEWDGRTWRLLVTDPRLERTGPAVAFVPGRGVVAYGGQSQNYFVVTHAIELRSDAPAAATGYGSGCPGSAGMPVLSATGLPWLGDPFAVAVAPVAPDALVVLDTGFSDTSWLGTPLPIDLAPHGFPGCALLTGPELASWLPVQQGVARIDLPVPATPSLVGLLLFQQAVVLERTGLATSAGLRLLLGQR